MKLHLALFCTNETGELLAHGEESDVKALAAKLGRTAVRCGPSVAWKVSVAGIDPNVVLDAASGMGRR